MADFPVKVYIYDLTKGLARSMSLPLLGKQLDGIWHTGIVVYDTEFFYGGQGIENCAPCGTVLGSPDSIVDLGTTQIPHEMFLEYLQDLSNSTFRGECYSLLEHNCNNFSSEVAQFLTGNDIPAYITGLPQEVLNTPFGAMIKPFLDSMQVTPSGGQQTSQSGASNTPATINSPTGNITKPSAASASSGSGQARAEAPVGAKVKYNEEQISSQFEAMKSSLSELCSGSDAQLLGEIAEYNTTANPLWSLSPHHLQAIERTLKGGQLNTCQQCTVLGLVQQAALRPDVIPLLKADRQHALMGMIQHMETQPVALQRTLAKTLCNCLSVDEGHKWCMEDADWTVNSTSANNLKVTLNTCVTCLLAEDTQLMEAGTGIACNLTSTKVPEDVHVEIGSALIQMLSKDVSQPTTIERSLEALSHCMTAGEVTALAKVMGLDLSQYEKSSSSRITQLVKQIREKLEIFTL